MTRIAIIDRHGKFWGPSDLAKYRPDHASDAPMVIKDDLDYTLNPANGRRYTSKRAYYKAVRAAGCEIVGNETQTRRETPADPVGPDVQRAIAELRSR
jgi:hypothetical protein